MKSFRMKRLSSYKIKCYTVYTFELGTRHISLIIPLVMFLLLTACIGITQSVNIRFEAANEGHATINCASDLSTSNHTYGGIFFCESQNVSFSGIQFERCGPYSSNVFFNASSEIIFTNSVFRYLKCSYFMS